MVWAIRFSALMTQLHLITIWVSAEIKVQSSQTCPQWSNKIKDKIDRYEQVALKGDSNL